jgi:sporulation protein YlmC with PRC-barrel domain
MANDNMKHRRLQELGESDFEIVDGQPDIRGWEVKNESGRKIGEVEELILDAKLRKVRYMVVELDDDTLDLDDDREVLIPIGLAQLHREDDDVILSGVSIEQLRALPEYDDDHLDAEVERQICSALGRTGFDTISSEDHDRKFYEHEHFNDANLNKLRLPESTTTAASGSYLLRDRIGQSGSEVEGYTGSDSSLGRDRDNLDSGRTHIYRDEEIEEDATIPVNRDISNTTDEHLRNNLSDLRNQQRDSLSDDSETSGRQREDRPRDSQL